MSTRHLLPTFTAIAVASGCATVHPGMMGLAVDEHGRRVGDRTPLGLRVSSRELDELSSQSIGAVEVTLENTSNRWLRVHEVELDFGGPVENERVAVLDPEELRAWFQGAQLNATRKRQNADGIIIAVALGGLLLGLAGAMSDSPGLSLAGDLAITGSMTAAVARDLNDHVEAAQTVPVFPENHLFATPFAIPPGLAVKKLVVLETGAVPQTRCLAWMAMRYRTGEGPSEHVRLRVRYPGQASDWRTGVCR